MKFIKEDVIKEDDNYYYFIYGIYNKKQYRFLNVYNTPKWGNHCLYKDYENLSSRRRLKYKVSGLNPSLTN
jgi:hypothetical protein